MKLRNKKTGEIGNLKPYGGDEKIWVWIDNKSKPEYRYNSLAELNEEWEDVPEEPKEYWYLSGNSEIRRTEDNGVKFDRYHKEVGNYFSSREEAEKAVEKLKAWKRLRDKGFRFEGRYKPNYGEKFIIECSFPKDTLVIDVANDLDLLFGGEE